MMKNVTTCNLLSLKRPFYLILLCALIFVSFFAFIPRPAEAQDAMVGHWPMDEGGGTILVDSSGSSNNGTIIGGPSWVNGERGLALSLNGSSQYATVPDNATLDITHAITLAAWIGPQNTSFATQRILAKAWMGNTNGYELSLSSGGKVFVRFNQKDSSDNERLNSSASYPIDGTWMHVAATYDGSKIRMYINGVCTDSLAKVFTIGTNADSLYIGRQKDVTNPYWYKGKLDDARIYNYALGASEILALAQHTIIASAGSNGGISPSGNVLVNHGASQTFTISPNIGYHVADVLVDGDSVGPQTSYTFTNVIANHTITASFAFDTLTIAASAGPNGSIVPSGNVVINYGRDTTFTITPNSGYHVADVLVDGGSVGPQTSYTFTNVIANHTITASFAIDTFTIVASAGANGTINPSGNVVVDYGANQTFAITSNSGYHVADVLVDGGSVGPQAGYTFTNVIANHTITASFAQDIPLMVGHWPMDEGSGTVLVDSSGFDNAGTIFGGPSWVNGERGLGLLLDGNTQFATIPDDPSLDITHAITMAAWVKPARQATTYLIKKAIMNATNGYELSLQSPSAGGRVFMRFNQATFADTFRLNSRTLYPYDGNTWVHLAATYDDTTMKIYINGVLDTSTAKTVTIASNSVALGIGAQSDGANKLQGAMDDARIYNYALSAAEILALAQHTIVASAGSSGGISPSGNVLVNHGDNQTFTITPNIGYHVADVLVDGGSVGPQTSYTFTNVIANHTIAASFAINTYTIVASAGSNGSIAPSGNVVINYGRDTTFTITPHVGYHVADVLVDGGSVGPQTSYTFTNVIANHTITASFAINTFTIVASAGSNGMITPSGNIVVNYGADQTFTITPNTGYHVGDVLVDGISVGPQTSYTFTSVIANHTIAASFAINTFTIVASAGPNGLIAPSGNVTVDYGADQTFIITPDMGYHVADVLVDGVSVGAVSSYTFTNVIANHTITASFAIDTFTIVASAGPNGSIVPSGNVVVNYGANQTFTITPNTGYHVGDVLVDGISVGPQTSYAFTNVIANHTITASFLVDSADLKGHWAMEEAGGNTIIDSSGYHNDGTLYGDPPRVPGIVGQALQLNGSNQYASAPDNNSLDIVNAITIMAWVKPEKQGTQYLVKKSKQGGVPGVDDGYELSLAALNSSDPPYGDGRVFVRFNQATSQNSYRLNSITPYPFDGNTWIHLAATYDGAMIRIYYNGIEENTRAATFQIGTNSLALGIGAQSDGVSPLDGQIDEVRIYNYALSAAQIRQFASHTITASAGLNGTISPNGIVSVTHGRDTTFTMIPNTGYHVADVLVDGVSVGAVPNYTFTNVIANHTISASFAINTYTITASAGSNGVISPSGSIIINYGNDTTFTITPNTGYHVADVLVDGASVGAVPSYTFTSVIANHTITASFAINTFNITANAGPDGAISPSGSIQINYGQDTTFTMIPNLGYHVADVLVDGISVGAVPSYTFINVIADHTISASFAINTYTIVASAGPDGAISPSGSIQINYGQDTTFTMTPDTGYHVADVLVDGVSVGAVPSYTFSNVIANHTIAASFAINTYIITAGAGPNGAISPSGSIVINYGDDTTFTITPNAGYHIADVLVDGVSVGAVPSYTFTNVIGNHTILASFALTAFTITATAGPNGSIFPNGVVYVNYGDNQTFTMTPNIGCHAVDVLVDGVSIGPQASYTFHNIDNNHTIEASFAINTYLITATAGPNGIISPSGSIVINYWSDTTFAITADDGYHIDNVLVDGESVGQVSRYSFRHVTEDHTIAASFAYGEAPVITSRPPSEGNIGIPYVYEIEATGTPPPTYQLIVFPDRMEIDSLGGIITWIPIDQGDYEVSVVASNFVGSYEQNFIIHVSTCSYVVGDINNNGALNGVDIVFAVNYFKGSGPHPPYSCECTPGNEWYVAGDMNSDCVFNGIDIVYCVNYFKGRNNGPIPCPDCPPNQGGASIGKNAAPPLGRDARPESSR